MCYYGTNKGFHGRLSVSEGNYSVDWQSSDISKESVSVLSYDAEETMLFTACRNGELYKVDAEKGSCLKTYKVEGIKGESDIHKILLLQDKKYAFIQAENEIVLYNLEKEKAVCTLAQEESRLLGIGCLDEKFLYGAAPSGLNWWKINKRLLKKPVSPNFSLELPSSDSDTTQVDMCSIHKSKPLIAFVTRASQDGGEQFIYLYKLDVATKKKSFSDDSVLLAKVAGGKSNSILSVTFGGESDDCIVAVESPDGPDFHSISFDKEGEAQALSLPAKGPAEEGEGAGDGKKRKQPEPEQATKTKAQQKAAERSDKSTPAASPVQDSTPLEVRVSQMAINNARKDVAPAPQPLQVAADIDNKRNHLNADSMVVLLSQALQSNDKQLLEQCLQVRQEEVISNTIKQLRSDEVGKLVPLLVERINSSSTRAMQVACWIRHTVRHHLTYIISAPAMKKHLSSLYQRLEERQSSYNALLGLNGRLELLTTYIQSMRRNQALSKGVSMANGTSEGYYSDPAVVHVHENDDVETISIVPKVGGMLIDEGSQHGEWDEEMQEAEESSENEES